MYLIVKKIVIEKTAKLDFFLAVSNEKSILEIE